MNLRMLDNSIVFYPISAVSATLLLFIMDTYERIGGAQKFLSRLSVGGGLQSVVIYQVQKYLFD